MPLYNYFCPTCDHEFEKLVMNQQQEVHCPECENGEIERRLSLPARTSGNASPVMGCDPSLPPCNPICGRQRQ